MTSNAIMWVFASVVLLVMVIFSVNLLGTADSNDVDTKRCQQSFFLNAQVRIGEDDLLKIDCPITNVEVTKDSLKKIPTPNMEEYGYDKRETLRYQYDSMLFDEALNCYEKVNYGKYPVFGRGSPAQGAKVSCIICSVISTDQQILTQLESEFDLIQYPEKDLNRIVVQKPIGIEQLPFDRFMNKVSDSQTTSIPPLSTSLNPTTAVVYSRTNRITNSLDNQLSDILSEGIIKAGLDQIKARFHDGKIFIPLYGPGLIFSDIVLEFSDKEQFIEIEQIQVIPYSYENTQAISEYCTTVANIDNI